MVPPLTPGLAAPVVWVGEGPALELHEHVALVQERSLVVREQVAAAGGLLSRYVGVVGEVRQDVVQALTGNIHEALVLGVLAPLRPVCRPRGRRRPQRGADGQGRPNGRNEQTEEGPLHGDPPHSCRGVPCLSPGHAPAAAFRALTINKPRRRCVSSEGASSAAPAPLDGRPGPTTDPAPARRAPGGRWRRLASPRTPWRA